MHSGRSKRMDRRKKKGQEFQERMITVEEWWNSAQKEDGMWVTHILSTEICISIQEWQGGKTEWS